MARSCNLSCRCGETSWTIKNTSMGRHIMCYCPDCQSFARHLKQEDRHLQNGGTQIFQTVPANVVFNKGEKNLALLRLSPRGTFRWYLTCCGTPLANTLPKRSIPFCAMVLPAGHTGLGKVRSHVNTEAAPSAVKQKATAAAVWAFLGRALASRLSGTANETPFFDQDGTPVSEPTVLSKQERLDARP